MRLNLVIKSTASRNSLGGPESDKPNERSEHPELPRHNLKAHNHASDQTAKLQCNSLLNILLPREPVYGEQKYALLRNQSATDGVCSVHPGEQNLP